MKKVVKYDLEYFDEETEEYTIEKINVSMIPNSVVRDFNTYLEDVYKIQDLDNKMTTNREKQGDLIFSKDKDAKSKIITLQAEYDMYKKQIEQIGNDDVFEKQYVLVKKVLIKNKVKDKRLLDKAYWDDNVSSDVAQDLLIKVVYKDFPSSKKKVLNQR